MLKKICLLSLCAITHMFASTELTGVNQNNQSTQGIVDEVVDLVAVKTSRDNTPLDDVITSKKPLTVLTFGTFDLFHIGHLNIIRRAKELANGGNLYAGVSSDEFSFRRKQKYPVYSETDRKAIVEACRFVDGVFFETDYEQKSYFIDLYRADLLVVGDDWVGKFDNLHPACKTIYLSRTEGISSTEVVEKIQKNQIAA